MMRGTKEAMKTGSRCYSQMTTTDTLPSSFNTAESLPAIDGSDLDTLFLSSVAGSLDTLPDLADDLDYIEDVEHWGIDAMWKNGFEVDSFIDADDVSEEDDLSDDDFPIVSSSSASTTFTSNTSNTSNKIETGCFTAMRHVVRLADQKDLVAKTLSTSSRQLPAHQRQMIVDEFRLLSSFKHENIVG
eukprot:CAMPEP_0206521580 /NCGR_PEP_ID=MMETSP0324_2-20121206/66421_1 /ASSEMBLY_ACC=CAM_ASM_000836 /TAXON_ID=2866 /ORGANISM="Crypthecodinium cohnii, Strain Seligo" /LENGTH=186 /DNA_ID=CAMNT_0054015479 /DNA_START=30 /DNA_END=587 /DNA_ORIENTATION=-